MKMFAGPAAARAAGVGGGGGEGALSISTTYTPLRWSTSCSSPAAETLGASTPPFVEPLASLRGRRWEMRRAAASLLRTARGQRCRHSFSAQQQILYLAMHEQLLRGGRLDMLQSVVFA